MIDMVLAGLTIGGVIAGFLIGYRLGKHQGKMESFEENQVSDLFALPGVGEQAKSQRVKE